MIKAIETVYKGYRFRSRLEARWAVFFDALGVRWEYEKEGFELGDGVRYLPDFWLPDPGVWLEIKGTHEFESNHFRMSLDAFTKASLLATQSEQPVFVFMGAPDPETHGICFQSGKQVSANWIDTMLKFNFGRGGVRITPPELAELAPDEIFRTVFGIDGPNFVVWLAGPPDKLTSIVLGVASASDDYHVVWTGPSFIFGNKDEKRIWFAESTVFSFGDDSAVVDDSAAQQRGSTWLAKAYEAARGARFEHGEKG